MVKRQGFTLLEVLVVIGVAAALLAVGLPSLQAMRQNASLNGGAQEVVSVLRQAQGQAIAGQGTTNPTIHFLNTRQYQVISGSTTTTYSLPNGVTFSAVHPDIVFLRRLGTTTATTLTVTQASVTKLITISATGVITI